MSSEHGAAAAGPQEPGAAQEPLSDSALYPGIQLRNKMPWMLKPRQDFVVHRFNQYCSAKSILLMHEVGTGKTITALAMALNAFNELYDAEPRDQSLRGLRVIVVCPSGIFKGFQGDLKDFKAAGIVKSVSEITKEQRSGENNRIKSPEYFNARVYATDEKPEGQLIHFHGFKYSEFFALFKNDRAEYNRNVEELVDKLRNTVVIFDEAHRLLRPMPNQKDFTYLDLFTNNNPFVTRKQKIKRGDKITVVDAAPLKTIFMTGTPYNKKFEDINGFCKFLSKIDNNANTQFDTIGTYKLKPSDEERVEISKAATWAFFMNFMPDIVSNSASSSYAWLKAKIEQMRHDWNLGKMKFINDANFESKLGEIEAAMREQAEALGLNVNNPLIEYVHKNHLNRRQRAIEMNSAQKGLTSLIAKPQKPIMTKVFGEPEHIRRLGQNGLRRRHVHGDNQSQTEHRQQSQPAKRVIKKNIKYDGGGKRFDSRNTALAALGLNASATEDDVVKAYRRLAKVHHPNMQIRQPNRESDPEKFKEISAAYECLTQKETNQECYGKDDEELGEFYRFLFGILNDELDEKQTEAFITSSLSIASSKQFTKFCVNNESQLVTLLSQFESKEDFFEFLYLSIKDIAQEVKGIADTEYGIVEYITEQIDIFDNNSIITLPFPLLEKPANINYTQELSLYTESPLIDNTMNKQLLEILKKAQTDATIIDAETGNVLSGTKVQTGGLGKALIAIAATGTMAAIRQNFSQYLYDLVTGNFSKFGAGIAETFFSKYGGAVGAGVAGFVIGPTALWAAGIYIGLHALGARTQLFSSKYWGERENGWGTKYYNQVIRGMKFYNQYDYVAFFEASKHYISFIFNSMKNISPLYKGQVVNTGQNSFKILPGYRSLTLGKLKSIMDLKKSENEPLNLLFNNDALQKTQYPKKLIRFHYVEYDQYQVAFSSALTKQSINKFKWWVKNVAEVQAKQDWNKGPRNFVLRSIGNYSLAYDNHMADWDKSTNKYVLKRFNDKCEIVEDKISDFSKYFKDNKTLNKENFMCPKFKIILLHLLLMKCGYILDNQTGIQTQAHYLINPSPDKVHVGNVGLNTVSVNDATHSFLPFVYSVSEFMGLNNFAVFLSILGLKYELLHSELGPDVMAQTTEDSLYTAYPLLDQITRRKVASAINALNETNEIQAQSVIFDNAIINLLDVPGIKEHPICILLHPDMTEGINGVFSPAIVLMEPPNTYGDYEQLCGRVLRTYKKEYDTAPIKYVMQFSCFNEANLQELVQKRFNSLLRKGNYSGQSVYYDESGDVTAGIAQAIEGSKMKYIDYAPSAPVHYDAMKRGTSYYNREGKSRQNLFEQGKLTKITEINASIDNLLRHAPYKGSVVNNLMSIYYRYKFKLNKDLSMYDKFMRSIRLGFSKASGKGSLAVAYYNFQNDYRLKQIDIMNAQLNILNNAEYLGALAANAAANNLYLRAAEDNISQLKNEISIILNEIKLSETMNDSPDLARMTELQIVDFQVQNFINVVSENENKGIIVDIQTAYECAKSSASKLSYPWCDPILNTRDVENKYRCLQNPCYKAAGPTQALNAVESNFVQKLQGNNQNAMRTSYQHYKTLLNDSLANANSMPDHCKPPVAPAAVNAAAAAAGLLLPGDNAAAGAAAGLHLPGQGGAKKTRKNRLVTRKQKFNKRKQQLHNNKRLTKKYMARKSKTYKNKTV